jgi:putative DNA primase/helicase
VSENHENNGCGANGRGIEVVRGELLEALAAEAPEASKASRPATPSVNGNGPCNGHADADPFATNGEYQHRLNVPRWLQARGVPFREKSKPDNRGRTVFVLEQCVFDPDHGDPDSCIMQEPSGKLSAQCFHDSCKGRGWQEFKQAIGKPDNDHYDPPIKPRRAKLGGGKSRSKSAATPPEDAPPDDSAGQCKGDTIAGGFPLTDLGNAERLARRHGSDLRHCHPWKKWFRWSGPRWAVDQTGAIYSCAADTVREIYNEAARYQDTKRRSALAEHAMQSEAAKAIRSMIDLARAQECIPILPADMDTDVWLLNLRNGTLDLRTGQLREHCRADHITKLCPTRYDPDAPCPAWETFLGAIFPDDDDEPDTELITFMQRLLGRCLTGDVSEQTLPIFWGGGANGKSTLINAVLETLGPDYSMKANADLLMASQGDRHPTERADLFGMRLVVASETHQGRKLNEALIKDLTGGEPIRARRMREDFWQFNPTHKIVLLTNHRPKITGTDEGIWRRLRLVPFEVYFWDPADPGKDPSQLPSRLRQDKQLGDKLKAERQGILAWLVRGCLDWQREGMTIPVKVKSRTREYRADEDVLARWIAEMCVTGDAAYRERSGKLYSAYKSWCENVGEETLTQKLFGPALEEHGFTKKVSDGVWYHGIAIRH